MTTCINRVAVNTALAKAIAYKQCGNDTEARKWAIKLVTDLQCADILKNEETSTAITQPVPRGWDVL